MPSEPVGVKLRTYHVGFGDCFLLSFRYEDEVGERHVLIDFGTTQAPPNKPDVLLRTAENISERIKRFDDERLNPKGELTAVVATHRHKDHIEGFRTSKKGKEEKEDEPGDIIRSCKPKLVMQPWTEDPDLDTTAQAPEDDRRQFRLALVDLQTLSKTLANEASLNRDLRISEQLQFIGDNNLANKSAVENLIEMGKAGIAEYVHANYATSLSKLLPGVEVTVLGPPTLKQTDEIKHQRSKDEGEFWHIWQNAVRAIKLGLTSDGAIDPEKRLEPVFPCASRYSPSENPPQLRWFRRKMRESRGQELLQLVRILDRVLNNTSVILLFTFCGKTLLFPGDAQIENWSYALANEQVCKKLGNVHLYKVGHHGSLNATPKSLLNLLLGDKSGDSSESVRLKTVVSTLAGKHGHPEDGTEVPRSKLVSELTKRTEYFSTQFLEGSEALYKDIDIL